MIAHFEQIHTMTGNSFLCKKIRLPHFDAPFHFHPEYELTYIQKSEGQRFVGNSFESFYEGDLLLIGKEVPHCWKNDINNTEDHVAEAIVVQFKEDFLGKDFFYSPELLKIQLLLKRSACGIVFHGQTKERIKDILCQMTESMAFQKVICLLQILNTLSESEEYTLLNVAGKKTRISNEDCDRMNKVLTYVSEHFHAEIYLKDMASLVHMTPSSFCRYFKKVNNKTLHALVNEYRIEFCKHKLIHTENSISTICYESGFQNISNFNKRFREAVKLSPSEYRAKFTNFM